MPLVLVEVRELRLEIDDPCAVVVGAQLLGVLRYCLRTVRLQLLRKPNHCLLKLLVCERFDASKICVRVQSAYSLVSLGASAVGASAARDRLCPDLVHKLSFSAF